MKSSILAPAFVAVVASAHEARSPLQLGLDVANLVNVELCLGLDVKLLFGISIDSDDCPKSPPPAGCTNVWHPPHDVDIDGCDNGASGWHYVHSCNCKATVPPHTWTMSTITATHLSTVIGCPASVANCPASSTIHTTIVMPATTTICPVPVVTTTMVTVPAPTKVAPPTTQPPVTASAVPSPEAPVASVPAYQLPTQQYQPPAQQYQPPVAAQSSAQQYQSPAQPPVVAPQPSPAYPIAPSQQPPAAAPYPTNPGPVASHAVPVAAPMGTAPAAYPVAPGNATMPPAMAGASTNGQKVGLAVAMGLVAAL